MSPRRDSEVRGAWFAAHAQWLRALLIAATMAALAGLWFDKATGFPIERDAYENLTAAYNLAHHGVLSMQDAPGAQLRPSEHREPLPIIALAGYVAALDPVLGDKPLAELTTGRDARLLKYSNIPWAILLALLVYGSTVRYTGSHAWAALGTVATQWWLAYQFDFLYSEIAAAALLAATSLLAALAVERRRLSYVFATGLCCGAMTLTKASFFYVSLVLMLCVVAWGVWRYARQRKTFALRSALLLGLGLVAIVGPWMARNYAQFDTVSLSGRGGIVLLTRAIKNDMTPEEYRGAWYAYAPRPLRWVAGKLTGFDKSDLEDGGRLVRLMRFVSERDRPAIADGRPDQAVSYYARSNAIRSELERRYPDARAIDIDAMLKQRALAMIKAEPLHHLAMTPLFLWRGAPYVFLILTAGALYAYARRRWWLLAYIAPSMGLVLFYAALTHFIPRYQEPMLPIAAVVFAVLGHTAWQASLARLRGRGVRAGVLDACALTEARMTEASR